MRTVSGMGGETDTPDWRRKDAPDEANHAQRHHELEWCSELNKAAPSPARPRIPQFVEGTIARFEERMGIYPSR